MYNKYLQARNGAWAVLIQSGIDRLPVDLSKIADRYEISIVCFSKVGHVPVAMLDDDGFSTITNGRPTVYLNDLISYRPRRRFTTAHEIGHVIMAHPLDQILHRNSEQDEGQSTIEMQANIFARDLLMPGCVLAALDVHTPEEIMQLCDVSYTSACIRAERLETLYQRGQFGAHPLERHVLDRFRDYIRDYRNSRPGWHP